MHFSIRVKDFLHRRPPSPFGARVERLLHGLHDGHHSLRFSDRSQFSPLSAGNRFPWYFVVAEQQIIFKIDGVVCGCYSPNGGEISGHARVHGLCTTGWLRDLSNIRNYSIYLKDDLLFGYYEYHGTDYQADMAKIASDPKTQEWWAIMEPMQKPLDTRAEGEWWAAMEEVFHTD